MPEFDPQYQRVSLETALALSPDEGFNVSGIGKVRPVSFSLFLDRAGLVVLQENDNLQFLEMDEQGVGISGLRLAPNLIKAGLVEVSFKYYKDSGDGYVEQDYRDVVIDPLQTNIGFGVHRDHRNRSAEGRLEQPSFYIRGKHAGYNSLDPDSNLLYSSRSVAGGIHIKNFSMNRIVNGPFGDPAGSAEFRELAGIDYVPPRQ